MKAKQYSLWSWDCGETLPLLEYVKKNNILGTFAPGEETFLLLLSEEDLLILKLKFRTLYVREI